MHKTAKLKPSDICLFERGRKFTVPEAIHSIKKGARGISNLAFDPLITESFFDFKPEVLQYCKNNWLFTATLIAKPDRGKPFGNKIVWAYEGTSVTLHTDSSYRDIIGFQLAANLEKDNFEVLSYDSKSIAIRLIGNDIRFMESLGACVIGEARPSTYFIPTNFKTKSAHPQMRRSNILPSALVSLIVRGNDGVAVGLPNGQKFAQMVGITDVCSPLVPNFRAALLTYPEPR